MAGAMKLCITAAAKPFLDMLLPTFVLNTSEMTHVTQGDMLVGMAVGLLSAVLVFHVAPVVPVVVIRLFGAKGFEIHSKNFMSNIVTGTGRIIHCLVQTPISNAAVLTRIIPEVRVILAGSVITTTCTTGRLRPLKRAELRSELWIFRCMIHEPLSDLEQHLAQLPYLTPSHFQRSIGYIRRALVRTSTRVASSLKACLARTHRRRPVSAAPQHGTMSLMTVGATMLFGFARAAPIDDTAQKDVTCIVPNMTLASDCMFDDNQALSPEAKGIIALTVVLVVLTSFLVILGIPQWALNRLRIIWFNIRLRQRSREVVSEDGNIIPAQAVGDVDTVEATASGTVAEPQGTPGAPRMSTRPDANTPQQQDELVAGTGALHNIPEETPGNFDEEDLGVPPSHPDDGLELQDTTAAVDLVREHEHHPALGAEPPTEVVRSHVHPRQGFDSTPSQAATTTARGTVELVGQASRVGQEQRFVPRLSLTNAPPSINAPRTLLSKQNTR